jgi:hypothetical protein
MRGVARRVGDLEASAVHALATLQDLQVLLGHGQHLAPQALHVIAVQTLRARVQPRGIDQVPRAALVHVNTQIGPALHERAGRAGVVEVDVGEQQRSGPLVAQRLQQRLQAGAGPGVDQHVVDLPAPDHARVAEMHEVDHAHDVRWVGATGRRAGGWRPGMRDG